MNQPYQNDDLRNALRELAPSTPSDPRDFCLNDALNRGIGFELLGFSREVIVAGNGRRYFDSSQDCADANSFFLPCRPALGYEAIAQSELEYNGHTDECV